MEGISRLIYVAYSLNVPERSILKINQIHYNSICNKKQHIIWKSDMAKSVEAGGKNEVMNRVGGCRRLQNVNSVYGWVYLLNFSNGRKNDFSFKMWFWLIKVASIVIRL